MNKSIVVYDACVLYPAPLRDLLMHLAKSGLFQAKWTNKIHEEWIENLLKNRPDLKKEQLENTKMLMNSHILDCLIENYEKLIPSIKIRDKDDRHVIAAAIKAHANIIVTFNIKDFPQEILKKFKLKAEHPDEFIFSIVIQRPDIAISCIRRQRSYLKKPKIDAHKFVEIFEELKLKKTCEFLKDNLKFI